MNNYVDSTLVQGETIVCSAHYHWFYWAKRILVYVVVMAVALAIDHVAGIGLVAWIMGLICAADFLYSLMLFMNDEMVITTHRVVLKTGIFSRYVFEMQIQKVETVEVDQSIPGRIFDYGTIICKGTGGTSSRRIEIASPLEFRSAFQNAVKESQTYNLRNEVREALGQNLGTVAGNDEKLDEMIALLREIRDLLKR